MSPYVSWMIHIQSPSVVFEVGMPFGLQGITEWQPAYGNVMWVE